ncbi:MAG: hypothetical protein NTV05_09630 [Acidobacteria bacterium]|nr:hypothetical protein [Acidobacteriota bacterium]
MDATHDQQPVADTPPPFVRNVPSGLDGARWDRQTGMVADPRRKHPLLAIVLSVMPGLGQIYVGYYQQGITLVIIAGALVTLSTQNRSFGLHEFMPLLVMSTMFTWLYSCVDAGRRASLYNQALSGLRPMDLPENQRTPEWHGSLVGGACLVVFGIVLFMHTIFGLPMEWVTRWWPLALVLVGAWLVYASIQSRAADAAPPSQPSDTGNLES